MKNSTVKATAFSAMFVALIAASAQITFPLPSGVPVTLQTLAIAVCGYVLGMKKSISSVLAYLLMGLIGLPVFSAFGAGIPVLFGKTGGFIIGFVFLVFLCGLAAAMKNKWLKIGMGLIGLVLCHLVGVLWFAYLTNMSVMAAAVLVSVPFLAKDAICVIAAALVSDRLRKILHISVENG